MADARQADAFDRLGVDLRLVGAPVLRPRRKPKTQGEIPRPDIDGIDTGCGGDGVGVAHAFGRLDHHDTRGLVERIEAVRGADERPTQRPDGPMAARRVVTGRHRRGSLLRRPDHRHDDRHGTDVEGLPDRREVVAGHARGRCDAVQLEGTEDGGECRAISQAMLLIHADLIEPDRREIFGDLRIRRGEPAAEGRLAGPPASQERVDRCHAGLPLSDRTTTFGRPSAGSPANDGGGSARRSRRRGPGRRGS